MSAVLCLYFDGSAVALEFLSRLLAAHVLLDRHSRLVSFVLFSLYMTTVLRLQFDGGLKGIMSG